MIDFYGDKTRWFLGDVISLADPLELGRIRVRIYGVHCEETVEIPEDGVPWAQVVMPIGAGGTKGLGNSLGVQIGARVFGIFLDGKDSQSPLILGSVPKYEEESKGGRSTNQLARGTQTLTKTPNQLLEEPDNPYAAVYPNNKVTETPSGHVVEFDDTPDAERIHIYHKSGTFVEMHPNGDVVTQHKNGFRTVTGNDKLHVTGNMEILVDGDMQVTVKGNVIEDFKKNQTTNVGEDVIIDTDSGKIYLN